MSKQLEVQCEVFTVIDGLGGYVIAFFYHDILENFMLPSADNLYGDSDLIFQQDLVLAHTAKSSNACLIAVVSGLSSKLLKLLDVTRNSKGRLPEDITTRYLNLNCCGGATSKMELLSPSWRLSLATLVHFDHLCHLDLYPHNCMQTLNPCIHLLHPNKTPSKLTSSASGKDCPLTWREQSTILWLNLREVQKSQPKLQPNFHDPLSNSARVKIC
ncbi:hypothetical protein AMECASPLE_011480 [Ameca splendens]|uniref:Uncharacterized protein n=1 Tax=Ameca splendens TaxID=208324 RepID=A0ABV0YC66_9TELE